jgi:hypothetical protein
LHHDTKINPQKLSILLTFKEVLRNGDLFLLLGCQDSLRRTTSGIARGKRKEIKCKANEKNMRGATQEKEQRGLRGLQGTLVVGHCDPYGPWDPIYDPRKTDV